VEPITIRLRWNDTKVRPLVPIGSAGAKAVLNKCIGLLLATAELHMVLGSLDATDNTEHGAEVKADFTTQNISR
jgi:hypothetical protein